MTLTNTTKCVLSKQIEKKKYTKKIAMNPAKPTRLGTDSGEHEIVDRLLLHKTQSFLDILFIHSDPHKILAITSPINKILVSFDVKNQAYPPPNPSLQKITQSPA